ncbi:MAG: cytochrome b561 [Pseudoalteromonas rhizosphaerae]|jgi:cytochrome b561|uniref:Cytochrome b n=1 Tax=Pseudoalteromonas neustonica TaxID=1840331 RepID=A0ABY3F9V7_9GAMM|nr:MULTISPECIES: cytochrome b [Pseudoalteromonas]MBB1292600.1 cytochrome b [Pseudoalteromonas sp. SR41-4]MBB1308881.1 cytochrome b [Pseudoalteromonas sp. SR41-8]MBB1398519.1 cytochrome b [Pseudoalteromonas sp. SG44-8]MBB1408183.1 cytochrome b [Pseudoalteromonas sp. SG44-17]MBB1505644.1 cytochrome b [Pseudoalteromonas sp. SG41-1]|tara:strand:- start:14716 stop:15252 length:537 start_codon:yes stop_codon:yes gene_type:complete
MSANKGYSAGSRLLHWVMALMLISMLFLGLSMVQSLAVWQVEAVTLHKSTGILALILVVLRLINKVYSCTPTLPTELPRLQRFAAHITHFGLYCAMILMPLSGWLMQNADGRVVQFFGLFQLPNLLDADIKYFAFFREMHGIVAWLFLAMIFMHISAALYHGLIKRDGVMSAMLTGKK